MATFRRRCISVPEIRGLHSGDIGEQARTIIPDRATAEIDVRLVKETDPERMLQRVLAHVRAQGFHVLLNSGARRRDACPLSTHRPGQPRPIDEGVPHRYDVARVAGAHPHARARVGKAAGPNRTMGGTVPIDFFIQALGMPAVVVPVVNFDNNQHSNNENVRIQNLWDAVVSFAAVLQM